MPPAITYTVSPTPRKADGIPVDSRETAEYLAHEHDELFVFAELEVRDDD